MLDLTDLRDNIRRSGLYDRLLAQGQDEQIARQLNEVQDVIPITRTKIAPIEILNTLDPAEFDKLSSTAIDLVRPVLNLSYQGSVADSIPNLLKVFAGSPNTLAALQALQERPGSQVEEWFGEGASVTYHDVGAAFAEQRNLERIASEPAEQEAEAAKLRALLATEQNGKKQSALARDIATLEANRDKAQTVLNEHIETGKIDAGVLTAVVERNGNQ